MRPMSPSYLDIPNGQRDGDKTLGLRLDTLAMLAECSPYAMVATNGLEEIAWVNAEAEHMFGYTRDDLLRRSVDLLVPDRFRQTLLAHRKAYVAEPQTRPMSDHMELYGKRQDGTEFPMDIMLRAIGGNEEQAIVLAVIRNTSNQKRAEKALHESEERFRAILDNSPNLIFLKDVVTDITERKRAEEALRASEERFRRYFDLGLIGMAVTSPTKGILEVNDELCRILGYERSELLQKTWAEMTHPDDLAADVANFDRVMTGELDGFSMDKRWIRKDGRVMDSIMAAKCLRRTDGSVDSFLGLVLDITKRHHAEEALKTAFEEIKVLKDKLAQEKLYLEEEIRTEHGFEEIVGQSNVLRAVLRQIKQVAPTDSTVLILGETGTGKERVARAIHRCSPRRDKNFITVNCAAIPLGLLESELFGHEKGAFTGAIERKVGRFELAHEGTLFLDEVGDIPLELQPKLLRVLQDHEFERLGSTRTQRVNVRLLAATHRDMARMIADGQFRSDLYYRLNVFPIRVPPLRDRPEDIPPLVRDFTSMYARRMNKRIEMIPADIMEALNQYTWPGNVRELQNFIERGVILSSGPALNLPVGELDGFPNSLPAPMQTLDAVERAHILRTLEDTHWMIGGPKGAAARLGLKRTTLHSKMKQLDIRRPQSR